MALILAKKNIENLMCGPTLKKCIGCGNPVDWFCGENGDIHDTVICRGCGSRWLTTTWGLYITIDEIEKERAAEG